VQVEPTARVPGIRHVVVVGKAVPSELPISENCTAALPVDDTVTTNVVWLVVPIIVGGNATLVWSTVAVVVGPAGDGDVGVEFVLELPFDEEPLEQAAAKTTARTVAAIAIGTR